MPCKVRYYAIIHIAGICSILSYKSEPAYMGSHFHGVFGRSACGKASVHQPALATGQCNYADNKSFVIKGKFTVHVIAKKKSLRVVARYCT